MTYVICAAVFRTKVAGNTGIPHKASLADPELQSHGERATPAFDGGLCPPPSGVQEQSP